MDASNILPSLVAAANDRSREKRKEAATNLFALASSREYHQELAAAAAPQLLNLVKDKSHSSSVYAARTIALLTRSPSTHKYLFAAGIHKLLLKCVERQRSPPDLVEAALAALTGFISDSSSNSGRFYFVFFFNILHLLPLSLRGFSLLVCYFVEAVALLLPLPKPSLFFCSST